MLLPRRTPVPHAPAALLAAFLCALGWGCGASQDPGGAATPDAATCSVPTAQELYPGDAAPRLSDPPLPADACLGAEHDVIVVLGCPSADSGAPSACQVARADIAVALFRAGLGRRFITTGGAVKNRFVEAEALRELLIARGVPAPDIRTEPRAEHTDENFYYSTRIMEAEGWDDALVVSESSGHLIFTALCDSNCCVKLGRLTVITIPIAVGEDAVQPLAVGHYVRYPAAAPVSAKECAHLLQPDKGLCINLSDRRACADRLQLPQP